MFLAGSIIRSAPEFCHIFKLSKTTMSLFDVSIEYVEDSIGDTSNLFDGLMCTTRGCNYIYVIMYSDNWQHTHTMCTVV